jgi:hypothetical protein
MSIDKTSTGIVEYGTKNKLVLGPHRLAWVLRGTLRPAIILHLLRFLLVLHTTQEADSNRHLDIIGQKGGNRRSHVENATLVCC